MVNTYTYNLIIYIYKVNISEHMCVDMVLKKWRSVYAFAQLEFKISLIY